MRVLHAAAALTLGATLVLSAGAVSAQEIVAAAPSATEAVAAGDVAVVAVAQLNDAADAAQAQKKIDLYKQLMELNGQARTVRVALDATKASTRLIVLERAGKKTMSAEDDKRYSAIADRVLKDAETSAIDQIARVQSQSFSSDEIQQLINTNASIPAAKYNAGKFVTQESNVAEVQSYMVDAVVKIIKTFKDSVAS